MRVIVHPEARAILETYYADKGGATDARLRMARVPEGAELIACRSRLALIDLVLDLLQLIDQCCALVLGEDTSCDQRLHLSLWVKVREDWADDARALAQLGME